MWVISLIKVVIFTPSFFRFQISKYHEYVLLKSTISFFSKLFPHKKQRALIILLISIWLFCIINRAPLLLAFTRDFFSHFNSFFTDLWIIKHYSVLHRAGASKTQIPSFVFLTLCVPFEKNNIVTLVQAESSTGLLDGKCSPRTRINYLHTEICMNITAHRD